MNFLNKVIGFLFGWMIRPAAETDRPNITYPEVTYEPPKFEVVKGLKFPDRGFYKTPSRSFAGLVVHYTVSGRTRAHAINVLKYLVNHKDKLCCMVMDEDGIIYIPEGFNVLKHWGYHAGSSKWNGYNGLNSVFAGLEICSWGNEKPPKNPGPFRNGFQPYTEKQEKALIDFCLWALEMNPAFKIANICGHHECSPGRKFDPGDSLSMGMPGLRKLIAERSVTARIA